MSLTQNRLLICAPPALCEPLVHALTTAAQVTGVAIEIATYEHWDLNALAFVPALIFCDPQLALPEKTSWITLRQHAPLVWLGKPSAPQVQQSYAFDLWGYWSFADTQQLALACVQILQRLVHERMQNACIQSLQEAHQDLQTQLALLRQDQEAGHFVQQKLLPPSQMQVAGLDIHYALYPSLYLSGDFVDTLALDEKSALFYVADVSGHGASSAFVTILLKYLVTRACQAFISAPTKTHPPSPADLLAQINTQLLETDLGKHLTIFLAIYDRRTRTLTYSTGAHLPVPVLVGPQGQAKPLPMQGLPVGLFAGVQYPQYTCQLEVGAYLVLASDGVFELLEAPSLEAKEADLHDKYIQCQGDFARLQALLKLPCACPDDLTLMTISGF